MSNVRIIVVKPGQERIDILAQRVYGNPYEYVRIMRQNPTLDIFNIKPGTELEIDFGSDSIL